MTFSQRREILFLYSVADANPNGDPLNQNHPRYDEETEQVLVSDVRIKRTIRDQWVRDGKQVFVDGESKTLKQRYQELKKITGKEQAGQVLGECLDARIFGVTFALGSESFSWTGPVQFKWGRSLHAVSFDFIQGTSAFASKEGSQHRSFRNEYKLPFALLGVYGIANQYAARQTGATDQDLDIMAEALWAGTDNLITRSKNEHKARLYVGIQYREGFAGKIGSLEKKMSLVSDGGGKLTYEEQRGLRSVRDFMVNIGELIQAIQEKQEDIKKVTVYRDPEMRLDGMQQLLDLPFTMAETR